MARSKSKKQTFRFALGKNALSKITRPTTQTIYPTLAFASNLNPNAKTFKPKRSLDIREMTRLLSPRVKGLNPLAKTFSPKKKQLNVVKNYAIIQNHAIIKKLAIIKNSPPQKITSPQKKINKLYIYI